MKKRTVLLLTLSVIVMSFALVIPNTQSAYAARETTENPGDVVDNPWGDIFTSENPTGDLEIDVTTDNKNSTSKDMTGNDIKTSKENTSKNTNNNKKIKKASIKKIYAKKISSTKLKVKIKKMTKIKGYQIAVYKTKKNAKRNKKAVIKKYTKKHTYTIKSKKIKGKKTLYVRVRAYASVGKRKVYGDWSKYKKVRIKK